MVQRSCKIKKNTTNENHTALIFKIHPDTCGKRDAIRNNIGESKTTNVYAVVVKKHQAGEVTPCLVGFVLLDL
jgi:cytidine deaminase